MVGSGGSDTEGNGGNQKCMIDVMMRNVGDVGAFVGIVRGGVGRVFNRQVVVHFPVV